MDYFLSATIFQIKEKKMNNSIKRKLNFNNKFYNMINLKLSNYKLSFVFVLICIIISDSKLSEYWIYLNSQISINWIFELKYEHS